MKNLGFTNIKLYNGGIKDWQKSGLPIVVQDPLPTCEVPTISTDQLFQRLSMAERTNCLDGNGQPLLTLLDLRTENMLPGVTPPVSIRTSCPTLKGLLDDMQKEDFRAMIPRDGEVVTISETGNRDQFAIRYLHKFNYTNITWLVFGMRGWIKAGYPVVYLDGHELN